TNYLSTSKILSAEGEGEQYAIFKNAVIPSPVSGGPFLALTGNQGTFFGTEGGDYINKFGQKKGLGYGSYCNYENAKGLGENSNSATGWWTRSPNVTNSSQYCGIAPSGQGNGIIATSIQTGVVFGFCL